MSPHGDPLAELILTVLSQSTNDRNRDVAYLRLRTRFSTWEAVRDAPLPEVEEAIRPGGISKVKSDRIQRILRAISDGPRPDSVNGAHVHSAHRGHGSAHRAHGAQTAVGSDRPQGELELTAVGSDRPQGTLELTAVGNDRPQRTLELSWLAQAPLAQARDYLTNLPGVGRKTAACVLLFAYGLREVPVDTHVSRVGTRLGLLRAGASFEELHDQMLALTRPGEELELHVNLLRHGRRTCHARAPECGACALARMCPSRGDFL
jgi:endonuclease-3